MPVVTRTPLMQNLYDKGLLPERCYAITIREDANGGPTTISYACYMTDEVLKALQHKKEE